MKRPTLVPLRTARRCMYTRTPLRRTSHRAPADRVRRIATTRNHRRRATSRRGQGAHCDDSRAVSQASQAAMVGIRHRRSTYEHSHMVYKRPAVRRSDRFSQTTATSSDGLRIEMSSVLARVHAAPPRMIRIVLEPPPPQTYGQMQPPSSHRCTRELPLRY